MIGVVLGGAAEVWEEFAVARELLIEEGVPYKVIAANRSGVDWPSFVDHWATYHQELMEHWVAKRRALGYPDVGDFWSNHRSLKYPVTAIPFNYVEPKGGSSGMIATQVAVQLYGKAILCGVPMDTRPHYYSTKNGDWQEAKAHQHAWKRDRSLLENQVRSMSGFTKELFGAPTKEFINGNP